MLLRQRPRTTLAEVSQQQSDRDDSFTQPLPAPRPITVPNTSGMHTPACTWKTQWSQQGPCTLKGKSLNEYNLISLLENFAGSAILSDNRGFALYNPI